MQVKSIAECSKGREHSAILLTFIKLPVVIKIFVLSIFEWPFYTGFVWDCVAAVECLPALHYSVDFIFLSFGILGFIVEL